MARIAIIGGGISGISAARVLLRFGHEVVVLERGPRLGGVWAVTYPEVRLQNIAEQYRLSDFPWPFPPDLHPTREQILRYLGEVVAHFHIDLRLSQKVVAMNEAPEGWDVEIESPDGASRERFDFVVIAIVVLIILVVIAGHAIGLVIPESWTNALGISESMYHWAAAVGARATVATAAAARRKFDRSMSWES